MHHLYQQAAAFAALGLETPVLHSLVKIAFTEPTDIQNQLIPLVLQGRDVIGQARTGTGKTAAFGLPILQRIEPDQGLQFVVLVPTRELAVQVAAELRRYAEAIPLRIVPIYGGQKIKAQLHLLGRKPCVVVGTPGRIMDMMQRGAITFEHIRFVVLDEVDRMLDIGFRDDIRWILGDVKTPHQTVLVSATINDEIKRLAQRYMTDPVEVDVSRDELTVAEVAQAYMTVEPWDKFALLLKVLDREQPKLAIVFCNTKRAVSKVAGRLHDAGIDATEIHGDLVQRKRERVMERFRKHHLQVLVATDLAARGIDVRGITHIINYDTPDDADAYVHRIGRTARMGSFGKAITLVTREQGKQLTEIEKLINKVITRDEVEGFVHRPPPREQVRAFVPSPVKAEVAVDVPPTDEAAASGPMRPRTLGGRFKSRRRRR
jgi:ATP-dependent RNA helicase DeaD